MICANIGYWRFEKTLIISPHNQKWITYVDLYMLRFYGLLVLTFLSYSKVFGQYQYVFCDTGTTKSTTFSASVYFESGKYELNNKSKETIDSLVNLVQQIKARHYGLSIIGFSDTVGDSTLNFILSNKRVEAVAQYYNNKPVIRKLCVGFWDMRITGFNNFFTLEDKLIDTIKITHKASVGENQRNNDSTIKNRRVSIQFEILSSFPRQCRLFCCKGYPENDTTINAKDLIITIPKYALSFFCQSSPIDTTIPIRFYSKTDFLDNKEIANPITQHKACRFIQMTFEPNQAFYRKLTYLEFNSPVAIDVKIPLTFCEAQSNVRLYHFHTRNSNDIELNEILYNSLRNLSNTEAIPQKIITQNDTNYLVATVPILETDSLILAYPYTEPKKDIYRQLVFRGKTKIEPYIVNGCALTAIDAEPSTTFFFFNRSKTSISSKQRVVYLKSDETDKFWPVKLSQFKKRGTRYILTKKELKRIKQGKSVVIKM